MADLDEWSGLDGVGAATSNQRSNLACRHRWAVKLVQADAVKRAVEAPTSVDFDQREQVTRELMLEMVALPMFSDRVKALRDEVAYVKKAIPRSSLLSFRVLNRHLHGLRGGAAAGPSSWRNRHLKKIGRLHGRAEALMRRSACSLLRHPQGGGHLAVRRHHQPE